MAQSFNVKACLSTKNKWHGTPGFSGVSAKFLFENILRLKNKIFTAEKGAATNAASGNSIVQGANYFLFC
jgi:hypothetical protein